MSDAKVAGAEEIVVIRLEGLGTFAVPVSELRNFQVAEHDDVVPYSVIPTAVVPVILAQDFLRGPSSGRSDLVVDRFGAVSRRGDAPVLEVVT